MLRALPPAAATLTIFFLQALSFGGWFARIGDIQIAVGLTEVELGIAITGMMAGALLTYPLTPPAVERFGTRLLLLLGLPGLALGCALSTLAWDGVSLFLILVFGGICHGFATMAINVEADRYEGMSGRRVMNTCHGLWSLGFVAATLLGTAARGFSVSPGLHLGAIVVLTAALAVLVCWPMRQSPPRPHIGPAARRLFPRPTRPILLLIGFVLASVFLEGGSMAWSVIYLRDSFDTPVWIETLTLPAFLLTTALGRLLTDRWVERFGPARVAATLAAVCLLGLVPVIWAGSLPLALLGFALIGFGVSAQFPLAISAAARIGDRPAAENVAAFAVIQRGLSMFVPALIGIIAGQWGLPAAFAAMIPFPLIAIALSRHLEPRPATALLGEAK